MSLESLPKNQDREPVAGSGESRVEGADVLHRAFDTIDERLPGQEDPAGDRTETSPGSHLTGWTARGSDRQARLLPRRGCQDPAAQQKR